MDFTDKIAIVALNRPERMNASRWNMAGEINGFFSGADLSARSKLSRSGGEGSDIALTRHCNPLIMNLARLNMPIITAINGAAAVVSCSIGL